MGGCYTVMDAGKAQDLPDTVHQKRLPLTLKPQDIPMEDWIRMRPDIMLIPALHTRDIPDIDTHYRICIIEIGYCSDTNHSVKHQAKLHQHTLLCEALTRAGHIVKTIAITLGTTGTLAATLPPTLGDMGVDREACDKVIAKLHKNATHSASNIITMRRHLEWTGEPA